MDDGIKEAQALLKQDAVPLMEMANLGFKETGIAHYVWVGPHPATHGPRVKVVNDTGRIDPYDSFSVSIPSDNSSPKIVAGIARISGKELQKVFTWVSLNREALLLHAAMQIDDSELRSRLRSV